MRFTVFCLVCALFIAITNQYLSDNAEAKTTIEDVQSFSMTKSGELDPNFMIFLDENGDTIIKVRKNRKTKVLNLTEFFIDIEESRQAQVLIQKDKT